jgi:predicted DCC family thiol-disulfide oxidoreductase YuxK
MPAPFRVHIDGACALCNGLARFVKARDKRSRFEFIPDNETGSVILYAGGRMYTRSAAALLILSQLGFPWSWLARAALLVPSAIRDAVYDAIARNRRRLSCPLP